MLLIPTVDIELDVRHGGKLMRRILCQKHCHPTDPSSMWPKVEAGRLSCVMICLASSLESSCGIPPQGCKHHKIRTWTHLDTVEAGTPSLCDCLLANGSFCNMKHVTLHMRQTRGGTHDAAPSYERACLSSHKSEANPTACHMTHHMCAEVIPEAIVPAH